MGWGTEAQGREDTARSLLEQAWAGVLFSQCCLISGAVSEISFLICSVDSLWAE